VEKSKLRPTTLADRQVIFVERGKVDSFDRDFLAIVSSGVHEKGTEWNCSGRPRYCLCLVPTWRQSEAALRKLRKAVTFAVYAEKDDLDEVAAIVEKLLAHLLRSATKQQAR
jgi:hypothetical protein